MHNLFEGNFLSSLNVETEKLKVDPEVMKAKAEAINARIRELQVALEVIENTMRKTQNYWIGEAGDAHREIFSKTKDDRDEMFKRLTEDAEKLYTMAAGYVATDSEVKQIAESLPADVLV